MQEVHVSILHVLYGIHTHVVHNMYHVTQVVCNGTTCVYS